MKTKIIKSLYKKEILDVLRDKKTVLMMLVVPLVLYPLIFVLGMQLMVNVSQEMATTTYRVAIDFEDDGSFANRFQSDEEKGYYFKILEVEDVRKSLAEEEIDVYITKTTKEGKDCYNVYYLSAVTNSSYAMSQVEDVLKDYSSELTLEIIEAAGLNPSDVLQPIRITENDLSSNEAAAGSLLGTILPFMLIVSLLLGTMYPAIDTTAGERERGTLETILTLPVSNHELIISKFFTVATIGIVSALLNIIAMGGVGVYMYKMMDSVSDSMGSVNMAKFIPAILIGILCVLAFAIFISAISMCVCAFAKSYKEANNYITPLMLVVMFASFVTFIPNTVLTNNMALIPVANVCLLIRDLLLFKMNLEVIIIVLVSNIAYGIITIFFLGKIYRSEAILFGDGSTGVQIFEKRSNMKKGGVPTTGDAWLVLAVTAVLVIYVGSMLQLSYGNAGAVATQCIIIGIPFLCCLYTKKDILETFKLKSTKVINFLGAIFMVVGAISIGMLITMLASNIFPSSAELATETVESLFGGSFVATLLIVALLPAICEEMMFRGYLFSAFVAKMKPVYAILLSSALFGIYHMSVVRFFTTAFLGFVICYVRYMSGSIFPGMMMHFINNALSVIATFYPDAIAKVLPIIMVDTFTVSDALLIAAVGIICLTIGQWIIKNKGKVYVEG